MNQEEGSGRRRRGTSEVDPLEVTAYRTVTNDDHDWSAASHLPDTLHLTTSITSFRRRSSLPRRNSQLSNEPPAPDEEGTAASSTTAKRHEERIDEDDEDGEDVSSPQHLYADDNEVQRRGTTITLPSQVSQPMQGEETEEDGRTLSKVATTKSVKLKRKRASYLKVAMMFGKVYILLFVLFIGILSIYWGSWFHRTENLVHLQYLVVSEEEQVGQLPPLITETLVSLLNSTGAHSVGTYHFKSNETIAAAAKNNRTVYEQVIHEVHVQKYWGGFYIPANLTLDYYQALKTSNTTFNTTCIDFVYESSRKAQSVNSYVVTPMLSIEKSFAALSAQYILPALTSELTDDEQLTLATNGSSLISGPWFTFFDNRPVTETVILGPIQIGLVYILVMSFHQFNFASAMHDTIREQLHLGQYLVYHMIASHIAYIVLALVYTLMSAAFQAPFNAAFGQSGFLVEWAFVYLSIAAMGGINENVAVCIFAWDRPFIGPWIVFFMVTNLSPVFSPMPVMSAFYRYGYAMPMYCAHELLTVVFLNTYKGDMGRHIGILIAWIVLTHLTLPFSLKWSKRYKLKVAEKAKAALENSKQEN